MHLAVQRVINFHVCQPAGSCADADAINSSPIANFITNLTGDLLFAAGFAELYCRNVILSAC